MQGVGFRPFVYRLALELGLAGSVRNFNRGVRIFAQGQAGNVEQLIRRLRQDAPPLARIRELTAADAPPNEEQGFRIAITDAAGAPDVDAAPDIATCEACLAEMRDPANRRYRHPFINCTDCGPRYTIIRSLPYDRPNTSMRPFQVCPDCEREYNTPTDRRFHAQPVCCPECGPQLELLDANGVPTGTGDPISDAAEHLAGGKIVAVKGVGGFHLACDATSPGAVRRLRRSKYREEKALAVMARSVEAASRIAHINRAERALLESPERPIVLLRKKGKGILADEVDPRSKFHGLMLPYTPIHHLLVERVPYLVMTSGNKAEEPIARTNAEALDKLSGVADLFLMHNREILTRSDDSVVRHVAGDAVIMRRSRGYAPQPISVGENVDGILACGPMLKNCIAVGRGELAYVSQHIGDLTNLEAYRSLEQTAEKLCSMLAVEPSLAACDMHPSYASTRFAESLGLPVARVQHHHAHVASCMAENGLEGRVIGVAFDGTGYGEDGNTWGSEIFVADRAGYERLGHLSYMKMPGGDAAVKYPGRMALGALFPLMGSDVAVIVPWLDKTEAKAVVEMLERGVNVPLTAGMGRLFDAASALLNVCSRATYQGQPAIELEGAADPDASGTYPISLIEKHGQIEADGAAVLAAVCEQRDAGVPVATIAGRFHNTVAELLVKCAVEARERTGLRDVCLSGGCFQNALLLAKSVARLTEVDFVVHRHRLVPPNDGCIALGQMVVAASRNSDSGPQV